MNAITQDGWVPGAKVTFKSTRKIGDYHGQMNQELFEKWFREKLLPNIPDRSLIIMDNASYHNVLTPYHPELQPIETCWGIVKNEITRNCDFTMANLMRQLESAFDKVTAKTCAGLIRKIRDVEDEFWRDDVALDENN